MRVAVVLTGQPRYLEQSAWWWKNKVFPSHYQKLQVDYFCQFWQDNTDNLHTRIIQQFNPTQLVINNYHESLISFRQKIQTANENCNDWHRMASRLLTWDGEISTKFLENNWLVSVKNASK